MPLPGSLSKEPQPEPQPTSPKPEQPWDLELGCWGYLELSASSPSLIPQQPTEKEFQFLQCQSCQEEAKCPKLLPCLHSLCSGCLKTPDSQCPICKVPGPAGGELSIQDNVFFESLQRRLSMYRKIMDEMALCTRCKETADFWCSECEQLLCARCFEAHQWFLVKHEPRPLGELRRLSELEFLDSLRKTNNIFCSHPDHGSTTTNIYCRGCSKPMCCSCAVLDPGHNNLRCHISEEIKQRQEELDSMTHKLREKEEAFGTALAQVHSNFSQLDQQHTDNKKLISSIFGRVMALVQAQECELLEKTKQQYQCNYQKLAGQQQHQDTVLQRIHASSTLVQKMKCYASDQEVLDMHDFLRQALHCLYQEKPRGTEAIVYINVFNEVKACLQRIVSDITQVIDAEVSRRESSEANNLPQNCLDVNSEVQVQASSPAQAQSEAVVQSVPGAHPVPVCAYSIRVPSCTKEDSPSVTPQKRKSCQNESPRKMMKMESKEEREMSLAQSMPEQPRPSTSRTISLPHLVEAPSPKEPPVENEGSVPDRDVLIDDPKEAAEERVVVISSSEDSDTENLTLQDNNGSNNESSDVQLEGPSSLRSVDTSLADPGTEDRPLVFFDLKIDNETQKISQLAALNGENKFRVLITSKTCFSGCSKRVSLEEGLKHFLNFLRSMHRPVLACYKLWGLSLPNFFRALDDINQLWELQKVTSGFLAILPLIRKRVPGASSFQLSDLSSTYLARNLNESSALASVLAMRDLCHLLEVSQGPYLIPYIYSFSNLHCFASLQPLVQAAVLPRPEARLLALRNVGFLELLRAYRWDPQGGLKKYNHYLSLPDPPSQHADRLQALKCYFESILQNSASTQQEDPAMPTSSHSHGHNMVKTNLPQS
ncbi:protein PML [Suncus etruscus]|uniref:protein PML n=1 Tax=Suncus etruscus TaxID=109475 RepID=UPI00211023D5|nr:protein PML [Suncus etruscus]